METTTVNNVYNRKILRIAVGSMFFLAGLSFASWASRIASIQQELGLSEAALGGVLLSIPTGLMCSLPFSAWLITKIGSRKLLIIAMIADGAALVGLGAAHTTIELIAALWLFGFCGNAANISVNTQAVIANNLYEKPIMASFHGLWSIAGFAGAGIGTFMTGKGIIPLHHFTIIFCFIVLVVVLTSRSLNHDSAEAEAEGAVILTIRERLKLMLPLLTLGIIAFCSMICEGAMFDWSVIYFKKVVQAQNAWIGAGYTAFMCTMALGRFTSDWFTGRYGLKRTLQLSGSLTACGLLIAVCFPHLIPSLLGFMLVGLGVSSVVPIIYSSAGKTQGIPTGVALTAVSTIGFVGFLVGPPIIGFVAGATSLRVSFTMIAAMGLSVAIISSKAKI